MTEDLETPASETPGDGDEDSSASASATATPPPDAEPEPAADSDSESAEDVLEADPASEDESAPEPAAAAAPQAGAGDGDAALTGLRLLDRIVQLVKAKNGSDIHLLEGERPRIRFRGDLYPLEAKEHPYVTAEDIQEIMNTALTPDQLEHFDKVNDIDFSMEFPDASGRVNVGYANGRKLHLVMRYLKNQILTLDDLGIAPEMLKKLASAENGLIIVAGETSSGKTTTIAAMLDFINHSRYGSIQTIENPVEYALRSDKCLITRREIGRDTPDFHHALRASVRKNPDVLLIGEVRDFETANIALTASETGIQTFCTLHAIGSIPAITRLRNIMTAGGGSHTEFYQRLAQCLAGIISQQLIKTIDGGIIPLYEILNMGYAEKNYLRDNDFVRLEHSLQADHNISMGSCVYDIWHEEPRRINEEMIHHIFGDQFRLIMNRLGDPSGWKPLATGM